MADFSFLPIDFLNRMEQDLGPDFHAFLSSYEENKISALRFNTLKTKGEVPRACSAFLQDQVKWSPEGYYYDEEKRPGLHPYHHAGVYYIQDASAQLPAAMLAPSPGDFVLDLCAAPGGKSTQLAASLQGQGLLISNEPIKNRARILSENIERMGITNAIVVSEYPDKLTGSFPHFFDKIMVDAPCSGEGMFRKNHDACTEWSLDAVAECANRQAEILEAAYQMLIPGGRICYSTCTFARDEDEKQIEHFISLHPDMRLIEERRLWPHKDKGEGHYAALLIKEASQEAYEEAVRERSSFKYKKLNAGTIADFLKFEKDSLKVKLEDNLIMVEDALYVLPAGTPRLDKIHVLRGGLCLGTFKKNRFEPAHALALALKADEVVRSVDFSADSEEIHQYLLGQALSIDGADGWTLVTVDGYSIGWGKVTRGLLKNHYPKGLRLLK